MKAMKPLAEATQHKIQMQLKEVEVWAEREAYHSTGNGVGVVKTFQFDISTSWADLMPVQDCSSRQLLGYPRESHILHRCNAGSGF
jgi:hypothetical protein